MLAYDCWGSVIGKPGDLGVGPNSVTVFPDA